MIIGRIVNGTEHFLSELAPIPIVGRVSGLVRVALGLIQVITSLALAILLTIPALLSKWGINAWGHCVSQTLHGAENVITGVFETVPIIGVLF